MCEESGFTGVPDTSSGLAWTHLFSLRPARSESLGLNWDHLNQIEFTLSYLNFIFRFTWANFTRLPSGSTEIRNWFLCSIFTRLRNTEASNQLSQDIALLGLERTNALLEMKAPKRQLRRHKACVWDHQTKYMVKHGFKKSHL